MQITNIEISNYRNLDGIKISFDPQINFLVGENELGKSNLLDLVDILFNSRQFSQDDFLNKNSSIKVSFSLHLSEVEKGLFEDHFTPSSNNIIKLHAIQDYTDQDEEIKFFWKEDESQPLSEIPSFILRNVNYIFYDSLKTPKDELTFYKGRGSGKFLSYLINEFTDDAIQSDIEDSMGKVIGGIKTFFDLVKPLKQQNLGLYTDKENPSDFASRVLKLSGFDGLDLQKSGYGAQFSILLILTILERLARIKQSKRIKLIKEKRAFFSNTEYKVFSSMYLQDKNTESILAPLTRKEEDKYYIDIEKISAENKAQLQDAVISHIKLRNQISMVLGLDEPEIHIHPYMQRSLIKYINNLIQNQDADFSLLLKKYFDIDALDGQILIVSHSPVAILNNYKQAVRFFRDKTVAVASGAEINLPHYIEKHLLLNFPYIKEAFFSKCVVLVEGETEAGALPLWAAQTIGDLDEYGIVVIAVGGVESIPPTAKLLTHFKIPNVSIIDRDKNKDLIKKYTSVEGLRTTNFRDFEEELFESIKSKDQSTKPLFDFLENYGDHGLDRFTKQDAIVNTSDTYSIAKTWDLTKSQFTFKEAKALNNPDLNKAMFLSWSGELGKGIILGRSLGLNIEAQYIPPVYQQLFTDALSKIQQHETN